MELSAEEFRNLVTPDRIESAIRVAILIVIILPVSFGVSTWARRWATNKFSAQQGLVAGKIVRYTAVVLVVLLVFRELGFSLAPLLGAAGVVGVALAFASQTSVSNIISGLFLITEKPFAVGDLITIGTTTGVVLSVDTLSVKLRTLDNQFVRIPNEMLIKTEFTNVTKFPVRRIDIEVGVAYDADLKLVQETLMSVARNNPVCLVEPRPLFVMNGFGDSSIDFKFGVWTTREQYLEVKNSIQREIKEAFDDAGIEIPFPQRVVHFPKTSSVGESEPVLLPEEDEHSRRAESE